MARQQTVWRQKGQTVKSLGSRPRELGAKSYKQQGVDHGFSIGDWSGGMCFLERFLLKVGEEWTGRPVRRPQPWAEGGKMRILEASGCEAQGRMQVSRRGHFASGTSLHLSLVCSSGRSTSSTPISERSNPAKLKSHLSHRVFTKAPAANKFSILSALLLCVCFSLWVPEICINYSSCLPSRGLGKGQVLEV